jgi:enoyl-CoA hydratase/carnithine racemase
MLVAINDAITELEDAAGVRAVVLGGAGPSFCSGSTSPASSAARSRSRRCSSAATARQPTSPSALARLEAARGARDRRPAWRLLRRRPADRAGGGPAHGRAGHAPLGDGDPLRPHPGHGADPQTLPGLLRADAAKELTFTGRIVEAPELGLISRIAEDPLAAAKELAAEIAARSPDAVRAAKRLLNRAWNAPAAEGLELRPSFSAASSGRPTRSPRCRRR